MSPAAVRDSVGNLPTELTSFVGRRQELHDAKALLQTARLLTLTGMGGVGKTRLARRLAADVQRAFPDGVWQVELAELTEPALVASSIAAALGLHEAQTRWTISTLQDAIAGRHLLLVLDNCEHLIDSCAVTVDGLLRSCPTLHVLATSRQPLSIDGEQTLPLRPLSVPNPRHHGDLTRLEEFDAVRLFVERAGAALPGFAVDRHNQGDIAELCHRLDGLPLALEFAALRVRALSPGEIVARLDRDAALSASGSRIAPTRQQTLRNLIDWSFQLCSEQERRLWCRLSVCSGRVALATAEGICGPQDLVAVLVELVDKSVLVRESFEGQVRYRMPMTIRDYGREQLAASGEERATQLAHLSCFGQLAAAAHREYAGPDQRTWFYRIRHASSDIRTALETALGEPDGAGAAVDLVLALLDYELAYSEGRYWLERALQTDPDDLVRARALRGTAYLAAVHSEPAGVALGEATELARRTGSAEELTWCMYTAGIVAMFAGDLAAAAVLSDEALAAMREQGDQHGLINVLTTRVLVAAMGDDLAQAQERADEFLALADTVGERWARAYVVWALAVATWRAGDLGRASELGLEAMALRLPFDDHVGLIWSAEVLAWVAADQGQAVKAAILLGAAAQAADRIGTTLQSFAFLGENHEPCAARLRAELGDDAFAAAVGKGRVLPPEQVYALAAGAPAPDEAVPTTAPARSPLTRRESEIAELVAEGISNKEIAARLVIAPRTAEGHVEHILVKLGFSSRAQIAAWVAERRTTYVRPK